MNSSFWWMAGSNKNNVSALVVSNGSLINVGMNDKNFIYQYKNSDGLDLHFRFEDFLIYLNDKIISIQISDGEEPLEWLKKFKF